MLYRLYPAVLLIAVLVVMQVNEKVAAALFVLGLVCPPVFFRRQFMSQVSRMGGSKMMLAAVAILIGTFGSALAYHSHLYSPEFWLGVILFALGLVIYLPLFR